MKHNPERITPLNGMLLTLAFVLEIVAFLAFAGASLFLPGNSFVRTAVGLVLLVALIIFWSVYMAPKAPQKLPRTKYYLAKAAIYAVAAATLFVHASIAAGVWFVFLAVLDEALLHKHNLS